MKNKWVIYGLLLTLLLNIIGTSPALAKITDVPTDHWAYHAIVTLVSKGYLSVYEDGTFQGGRSVDRYTLAVTLARILDEIEAGRVKGTEDDLNVIRELSIEFQEELALWYAEQESLKEDVSFTRKTILATDERVNRVVEAQLAIEERMEEVRGQVAYIENLQGRQTEQSEEYEAGLAEVVRAVIDLEKDILLQEQDIKELENWAGEKSMVIASLQNKLEEDLETSIASLGSRNKELERDIQNLAVLLQREAQQREDLALKLETSREELLSLQENDDLLAELRQQFSAERNASVMREKRLETQIADLEEEFEAYRQTSEKQLKSSKTMTTVAIAIAAVGVVLGFIGN
ncbi:MAG: hypothetical protein GX335_05835 [Firmicutes bacterium]|nr:hypothetical protein [Bacillota bacterium]